MNAANIKTQYEWMQQILEHSINEWMQQILKHSMNECSKY